MNETVSNGKRDFMSRWILDMGIIYILFLVWAILWKCGSPFIGGTERTINLLPMSGNTRWEMQFNIAVFIPFGFYLMATKPEWTLIKRLLVILFMSLLLEVVQFTLAIGRSDVTDLIMNTLGGMVGIAAYCVMASLFRKTERKVTLIVCVLLTMLELYMSISFMLFGQLYIGFMIIRIS